MKPQDSRQSRGLFCGPTKEEADVGDRDEALPRERGQGSCPPPGRRSSGPGETRAQMVDLKFCDLLGTLAAHDAAADGVRRVRLRRGPRLRRLLDPRLAGDLGVGHAADARRGDARSSTRSPRRRRSRSSARSPTRSRASRTPATRAASPSAPRSTCARPGSPTRLLRPRVRVLRLRRGLATTSARTQSHYSVDSRRGPLELRQARARLHGAREGGLLPARAARHAARPAHARWCSRSSGSGIPCEFHHHEVASGGQCEIDLRYQTLTRMADQVMAYKYVVKNVARAAGKTATFMPKPIFGDNGSGMHCHQSLWKEGTPLMADKSGYAGLSQLARAYVGGLLAHAPALLAFCAPTTNSYRRLVPGYEAPVNLVYSQRNRSACIRIPMYSDSPKAKRIEFRCPDAAANPYLAFSAMLMAGHRRDRARSRPGRAGRLRPLRGGRTATSPQVPGSLAEALDALEGDHEFLHQGRRLQRGADPDLDRLQARERGRRRAAPPAPGRVLPLLRLLGALRD